MPVADLIIRLRDQASAGLGKLTGALSGLSGKAARAADSTTGMAGAIRDGVLQANAMTFALSKAQEAVGFLNGKFEEAKNLQLEQINAASTFSALTGQSSEQAARFIENLNDKLAKSAATLPGATQDYKALAIAVQDNVLEAFKDPSGTLNQKGFESTLISMSESFGALTAASTRDISNTGLGLSKALGGASVAELRSIAFFEQNPVILNEIEKQLKAQNKQMKDLSIAERVKLLESAGKKFITEDFKKSAAESVDGLLQSFQSTLFDPSAGIFGIMRDLDPKTEGMQSAFTSLNEALIELIGPAGVFTQVSELLKLAGVELTDPMAALKGAIDFGVAGLKRLNRGLGYLKDFLEAGGTLEEMLRIVPASFGVNLSPEEMVSVQIGGGVIASALVAAAGFKILSTTFSTVNSAGDEVVVTLGQAIVKAAKGALGAVRSLGVGMLSLARSTAVVTGSMLRFVFALPGQSMSASVAGVSAMRTAVAGLVVQMRSLTFGSLVAGVQSLAAAGWAGAIGGLKGAAIAVRGFGLATAQAGVAMLANPLVLGIGAIALAAGLIYKYWQPLTQFFAGFVSSLQTSLAPVAPQLQAMAAAAAPVFGVIAQGIGTLIKFFGDLLKPVQDSTGASRSFGETIGSFVGGAIVTAIELISKLFGLISSGAGLIGNFVNTVSSIRLPGMGGPNPTPPPTPPAAPIRPIAVGSRYSGQIGWAAGGFLGNLVNAAQAELAQMPSGASLMVANSSETILPQGMLGAALRSLLPTTPIAPAPVGGGQVFNFYINGGTSDPRAIADAVIARIQSTFDASLSTSLGAM